MPDVSSRFYPGSARFSTFHHHGSILNGLGKTGTVFVHHTVFHASRLSLVLFAIPRWGIFAYLAALLISELVLAFLHIHALACEVPIRLPLGQGIVKPVFCLLTALGILQGLERSNRLYTLFLRLKHSRTCFRRCFCMLGASVFCMRADCFYYIKI
ncbi:MAG: polysaccharide biosynthesis C-terminal domain-containing protein [Clostridium fessum]